MAELTAERRAKLERWLDEAEEDLQRLMTNNHVTSLSHGDSASNRSFTKGLTADEPTLKRRISELKAELGIADSNSLCPFVPSNF